LSAVTVKRACHRQGAVGQAKAVIGGAQAAWPGYDVIVADRAEGVGRGAQVGLAADDVGAVAGGEAL